MTEITEVELKQLLPENLVKDKNVNACAEALDSQLQSISESVDYPSIYFNIDSLTSRQMDNLAVCWDVSVWRENWDVATKRNVLKTLIRDKRKVGTLGAVKRSVDSITTYYDLTEWWETTPKGTPHTFKIKINLDEQTDQITSEQQEDLVQMIDSSKPARSQYELILFNLVVGKMFCTGLKRNLVYTKVKQNVSRLCQGTFICQNGNHLVDENGNRLYGYGTERSA